MRSLDLSPALQMARAGSTEAAENKRCTPELLAALLKVHGATLHKLALCGCDALGAQSVHDVADACAELKELRYVYVGPCCECRM